MDNKTIIDNALFCFDNIVLEEHISNYVFISDVEFSEELIKDFGYNVENVKVWIQASELNYYAAKEKNTGITGTIISLGKADFGNPFFNYELLRKLDNSYTRQK